MFQNMTHHKRTINSIIDIRCSELGFFGSNKTTSIIRGIT